MPTWFVGKQLQSITVVGGTKNPVTGAITYGTANSLTDSIDFVKFGVSNRSVEIYPVNAEEVHNEPTIIDSMASAGEIKKFAGDVLPALAFGFTFAKVTMVTIGGLTYVFAGMVGELSDGVTSEGKNTTELSFKKTTPGGLSRTQT